MSEEPIINGIDVGEWELKGVLIPITECKHFEGIGDCKESKGLCVDNDNCHFKQFKRLQEENEKLYKALEEIREIAQIHQYFNPELLEIKGDIGQMQNIKMTEIYKKCNEVLK